MEYDKDGNLVQKTTRMGDSCLIEKFEYDKKGNLVKESKYSNDLLAYEQEWTYYE